jgi:hypothetical protein
MTSADQLANVDRVYAGSDGGGTKALYAKLAQLGPVGTIALNLFRAQKNSARAKTYRRSYRDMAYGRKQWAMENLVEALTEHADRHAIRWGWGIDEDQAYHRWVLYVDIPTGQVSFHTEARGDGPEYPGDWDGVPGRSPARIIRWCADLLDVAEAPHAV